LAQIALRPNELFSPPGDFQQEDAFYFLFANLFDFLKKYSGWEAVRLVTL